MARVAVGSPVHLGGGRCPSLAVDHPDKRAGRFAGPGCLTGAFARPRSDDLDSAMTVPCTRDVQLPVGVFSAGEPAGERLSFLVHQAHPPHGRLRQVGTEMCQYDTRTAPVAAVQLIEPRSKLLCRPPATANSSVTG